MKNFLLILLMLVAGFLMFGEMPFNGNEDRLFAMRNGDNFWMFVIPGVSVVWWAWKVMSGKDKI